MGYFINIPLFSLGKLLISEEVKTLNYDYTLLLKRHQFGDFGSVDAHHVIENNRAIELGEDVLSEYEILVDGRELHVVIMTESDRSYTVVFILDKNKLKFSDGGNSQNLDCF